MRGLPADVVERNLYRRTPPGDDALRIMRELSGRYDLRGVPGFFNPGDEWRMVFTRPGYFVPYRHLSGRIAGMMYRLDVPLNEGKVKYIWLSSNPDDYPLGTSSGAPLHYAGREHFDSASDVLLTEGALKADVASYLLGGVPIIASGGVSQWGEGFATDFKDKFPGRRAIVAYDSDWRFNPAVRSALERLMLSLRDAQVSYRVMSWPECPEAKGLDDYALALCEQSKGVAA